MTSLLAEGADTNFADDKKRTSLHFAAAKGDKSTVAFLIAQGANPNARDCNDNVPMHLAAISSKVLRAYRFKTPC